jgi:cellulose synthase/poly-beta-1,6-N-acetylglucosamine synthase-like glycosyltransferase
MESEALVANLIALAILLVYLFVIVRLTNGWLKLKHSKTSGAHPSTTVSIIIPARNEESFIGQCLAGLLAQEFPGGLLEILVVDDHSGDRTLEIVRELSEKSRKIKISVLSLKESKGKKAAIQFAMKFASGSLILCTDADCSHSRTWVDSMVKCFETENPVFISGPVLLKPGGGFFGLFQEVEFMSLVASGAGAIGMKSPIMCNGANLGFSAEAWRKLDGDAMKSTIASGDDVFLMLAMKKEFGAKRIAFAKDAQAMVCAEAANTPSALIRQRLRWVSKSHAYRDPFLVLTAVSVLLMNAGIVVAALAGIFKEEFLYLSLSLMLLKMAIDFPLLLSFCRFAGKKHYVWFIPIALPLVAVLTTFTATAGNLVRISWKGRKI